MARKINPLVYTIMEFNYDRAKSKGAKHFMKYLRGCGNNYISREEVREYVFNKYNHKCIECGSEEQLQIDHIISIYQVFKKKHTLEEINNLSNLQTLCKSCNSRKKP